MRKYTDCIASSDFAATVDVATGRRWSIVEPQNYAIGEQLADLLGHLSRYLWALIITTVSTGTFSSLIPPTFSVLTLSFSIA